MPGPLLFAGPLTALTLVVAIYGWVEGRTATDALEVSLFPIGGVAMLVWVGAQVRHRVAIDLQVAELAVTTRTLFRQTRTTCLRREVCRVATMLRDSTPDSTWTVKLDLADGESLALPKKTKLRDVADALNEIVASWANCSCSAPAPASDGRSDR